MIWQGWRYRTGRRMPLKEQALDGLSVGYSWSDSRGEEIDVELYATGAARKPGEEDYERGQVARVRLTRVEAEHLRDALVSALVKPESKS